MAMYLKINGKVCLDTWRSMSRPFLGQRSSRAREFHPHPLTEPCVKVSPHTALHTQRFVHRHNLGGWSLSCVPNKQAPCSGGSSLWQTQSCQTCCSNCTNLALGSQSLLLPVGVSNQDGDVFDKPDEQWWTRSVIAMARKHLQSECSFHSFIFSCSFFTDFLLMAGRKFVKHWPCFRFHDLRHRKV